MSDALVSNALVSGAGCFAPTELRSKRRCALCRCAPYGELDGGLVLEVPTLAPYDFAVFVAHQKRRAIPGVEAADDDATGPTYVRSFSACGQPGVAQVSLTPNGGERLTLRLWPPTYDSIIDAVGRIRALLGTDEDPAPATAALADDSVIGPLVRATPGLRVPRSWDRFESAVRIIVGQQISLAAACTLSGRIAARHGTPIGPMHKSDGDVLEPPTRLFPGATTLSTAGTAGLAGLGFTKRRVDTLVGFSKAVAAGELDLTTADTLDATVARLCELTGIGPWTAHLAAMRVFGHDDAFPSSDLGLRRAAARLVGHPVSASELEALAENWRPYRSWAAQHLWHAAGHERL